MVVRLVSLKGATVQCTVAPWRLIRYNNFRKIEKKKTWFAGLW